jgi:SAM-dependent methyltransferase
MENIMKLNKHTEYVGNELELFKYAVNWKTYFSKYLSPYISGDVLEVGAGIGSNIQYLVNSVNLINSWCFLEPDKNLASQIEINTININLKNKYIINGIISDIPEKKFDTILYIDVLEHINGSHEEIDKIKLRLKPNGILIVLVPAFNFLFNNFDEKLGHFRRYDKKLLLNEVNNRLKIEKLYYLDSLGFFASLVNKYILKKDVPSLNNIKFWDKYLITLSKFFDLIFFKSFGKSLIGVFRNNV